MRRNSRITTETLADIHKLCLQQDLENRTAMQWQRAAWALKDVPEDLRRSGVWGWAGGVG